MAKQQKKEAVAEHVVVPMIAVKRVGYGHKLGSKIKLVYALVDKETQVILDKPGKITGLYTYDYTPNGLQRCRGALAELKEVK